ncbi:MAG TPA: sulfotransferase [Candidatus Limnocylindria bacterium]
MTTQTPTTGPIFVAGLDRTGTSLIYALLASHPRLAMTRRMNWWSYFYDRFGDLQDDRNLDRCLETMSRYRRHQRLAPDFARLRADFVAGERSYGRLLELLERQHADRIGRPRWGDKSLHTERYAGRVFGSFPDARILHMIRDPRDRYASVIKRWKQQARAGAGGATAAWLASVALAQENERRYAGRYRMLRYEDLASDPEATLRAVCAFIGEEYEPRMLLMEDAQDFRDTGGNSSYGTRQPGRISTDSIGRFRSVLRSADIAFIQQRAGRVMRRLGYEPVATAMSGGARASFLLRDWPLASAKFAAWQIRERMRDLLGRSPSDDTMADMAQPGAYASNE